MDDATPSVTGQRKRPWYVSVALILSVIRAAAAIGISPAAEAGVYALWLIALLGILAWQKWALYLYLALLALEGISAVGMFLLEMGAYSRPTEGTLVSLIRFPLHLLATFIFLFPLRKQM